MVEKLTYHSLRIILDLLRIIVTTTLFLYASWEDWREREITDKVWVVMTICGIAFLLIDATLISGNRLWLTLIGISITFSFTIGFILFYLDFFGGADSKALMALSIVMPLRPRLMQMNSKTHPFIPIAVFNNSVIGAASMAIVLLTYNISRKIRGEKLFNGLEGESAWKKILLLVTGYKIALSQLKEKKFVYPLEEIEMTDSKIKRRIKVRIGITRGEKELEKLLKKIESKEIQVKIWVTPALPMIIFMTAGLIISIIYGDLLFMLVSSLKG